MNKTTIKSILNTIYTNINNMQDSYPECNYAKNIYISNNYFLEKTYMEVLNYIDSVYMSMESPIKLRYYLELIKNKLSLLMEIGDECLNKEIYQMKSETQVILDNL